MFSAETSQQSDRNLAPWIGGGVALTLVAAAYLKNREVDPELKDASLLPYCEDIATALGDYEYAVVGGLPIDAFNDDGSVIDPVNRTITVSEDFDAKLLRGNGTVRDYDIFVLGDGKDGFRTMDKETTVGLKQSVQDAMTIRARQSGQPTPVVSVFPFDKESSLFHTATILDGSGKVALEHGSSRQELPEEALETWNLVFPNSQTVKIFSPWEQYWRSIVRFASGVKTKDVEKLDTMLAKLCSTPGLAELQDGELCQAYENHHREMLMGNSRNALNAEWDSPDRDWEQVAKVGTMALARRVLTVGQRYDKITQLVQALPNVFDRFVGGH